MKFGGSSVGSSEAVQNVGRIIVEQNECYAVVPVLSAMFGVTDKLVAAVKAAAENDLVAVQTYRYAVTSIYEQTSKELISNSRYQEEAINYLQTEMASHYDYALEETMQAKKWSPKTMDLVSSLGERFSNNMLAAYLNSEGASAEYILSSDIILTDGVFQNAKPVMSETTKMVKARLNPLLNAGTIPCVTGFFGRTPTGEVATFGRGGSDLTASVLAHALDANAVCLYKVEYSKDKNGWMENWEDGYIGIVHDVDPSNTISELSYPEAAELAHFGKKVLHTQSVSPVIEKNIPILIHNTKNPENPGTKIHNQRPSGLFSSITRMPLLNYQTKYGVDIDLQDPDLAKKDALIVAMIGVDVVHPETISAVIECLDNAGIKCIVPDRVNGSANNLSVVISKEHERKALDLLHESFVDSQVVVEGVGVGESSLQTQAQA